MSNEYIDNLKNTIREYILEDSTIKDEIYNENVDFIFAIEHPLGNDNAGNPIGKPFAIVKPKGKNYLNIKSSIIYGQDFATKLENSEQSVRNLFKKNLKSIFLNYNLLFGFNLQKNLYTIVERVYLDENRSFISKNEFYQYLRKVLNAHILSTYLLDDFSACTPNPDDSTAGDENGSLYM